MKLDLKVLVLVQQIKLYFQLDQQTLFFYLQIYQCGDQVKAKWTNGRFYSAKIMKPFEGLIDIDCSLIIFVY